MSKEKDTKPKKKKHGLLIVFILILIAAIAGAAAAAVYYLKFAAQEIDLSKYISLDMDGKYNEYASFTEDDIVIDEKGLKADIDDTAIAKKLISRIEKKAEVEENEDLSNGDKVTIKLKLGDDWLKENRLKLTSDKIEIKVEDLDDTEAVDLFDGIEIEVEGISPYLYITEIDTSELDKTIRNNTDFGIFDEDGNEIDYYLDYFKNGDKLTIKADYKESTLQSKGYVVAKDTKQYKIEDQPYYITSKAEFTDIQDDLLSILEEKVSSEVSSINPGNDVVLEPTLEELYLFVPEEFNDDIEWYYTVNCICAIYKTDYVTTGDVIPVYYAIKYENLIIDNEEIDDENNYGPIFSHSAYTTAEEAYEDNFSYYETEYDLEKITIK